MTTEFQSKLFRSGLTEWDQFNRFKQDIEIVKNIDSKPQNLENLVDAVIDFSFTRIKNEEREIITNVIESRLVDNEEIFDATYRLVKLFFEVFTNEKTKDDNPDSIINDLSSDLKSEKSELSTLKYLIELIKNKSFSFEQIKRKKAVKVGVLPYLKGFNSSVELRGLFNKDFELGDDFESYINEVKLEETTSAVISVSISLDTGTPDKFHFQASPEDLTLLIDEFKVAVYKAKILQERVNFK